MGVADEACLDGVTCDSETRSWKADLDSAPSLGDCYVELRVHVEDER